MAQQAHVRYEKECLLQSRGPGEFYDSIDKTRVVACALEWLYCYYGGFAMAEVVLQLYR